MPPIVVREDVDRDRRRPPLSAFWGCEVERERPKPLPEGEVGEFPAGDR